MKKQSPKHRRLHSSTLLSHCVILVCFFVFISCIHQTSSHAENDTVKESQAINTIRKDSFAEPIVIPITTHNQPKVVKAGKPVIRIDSSNGGAPFFTNYGTEQGLALTSVLCSTTGNDGNLWFGTAGEA